MTVVGGETFGYPQRACAEWSREVPWSKFNRTQSLDVPDVKEFVRHSAECFVVNAGFSECSGLDDLRRGEMFHAVARVIVGGVVNQKGIFRKLRRPPHRHLRAHDLLDVAHERRALAAFWSKRMDHDVILLTVNFESI